MPLQPVRVELDHSPAFKAVADLSHTWNGFLYPRFSLDEVRKIAAFTQQKVQEEGSGWDSIHVIDMQRPAYARHEDDPPSVEHLAIVVWVGWDYAPNGNPSEWTTVVDPGKDGL